MTSAATGDDDEADEAGGGHPHADLAPSNDGYTYEDRVAPAERTLTLLAFYLARFPRAGEAAWRGRIERGLVAIDGRVANDPATPLADARRLAYRRPPWHEPPVPTAFTVLLDDAHLLVVDKPAGLPVLPGGGFLAHTLLHLVARAHGRDGDEDLAPAHRLDRGTSGLVLFTRTRRAARDVGAQFAAGSVAKEYLARCRGDWETPPEGKRIEVAIGRHEHPAWGRVWAAGGAEAREAATTARRLARGAADDTTLVALALHTGRPHQARIHAAAAGHPLVGDRFYVAGGGWRAEPWPGADAPPRPGEGGFLLHAARLAFCHPATGQRVEVAAASSPSWARA